MFGVDRFYAIVTPPQSSILSVSAIQQRPIVRDGQITIGTMTSLGLCTVGLLWVGYSGWIAPLLAG